VGAEQVFAGRRESARSTPPVEPEIRAVFEVLASAGVFATHSWAERLRAKEPVVQPRR